MDFLVKTDLGAFPQSIDFNFEEIKSELEEKLIKYKNLVVTEDGIKAAKQDNAKLNKLRRQLRTNARKSSRYALLHTITLKRNARN